MRQVTSDLSGSAEDADTDGVPYENGYSKGKPENLVERATARQETILMGEYSGKGSGTMRPSRELVKFVAQKTKSRRPPSNGDSAAGTVNPSRHRFLRFDLARRRPVS